MIFFHDEIEEPDLVKGLVAGVAGGLVASFLMGQFQALWTAASEKVQGRKPGRPPKPTTVKAADAISERVVGTKIPKKHQELAGDAMHYTMGASSGAVYGMLAEVAPMVTVGDGAAFGAAVWLAADEAALPALGLTKGPTEIPVATHVYAFFSHVVYGVVTEAVRRGMRNAL